MTDAQYRSMIPQATAVAPLGKPGQPLELSDMVTVPLAEKVTLSELLLWDKILQEKYRVHHQKGLWRTRV